MWAGVRQEIGDCGIRIVLLDHSPQDRADAPAAQIPAEASADPG
jgi:hypothetical protein